MTVFGFYLRLEGNSVKYSFWIYFIWCDLSWYLFNDWQIEPNEWEKEILQGSTWRGVSVKSNGPNNTRQKTMLVEQSCIPHLSTLWCRKKATWLLFRTLLSLGPTHYHWKVPLLSFGSSQKEPESTSCFKVCPRNERKASSYFMTLPAMVKNGRPNTITSFLSAKGDKSCRC